MHNVLAFAIAVAKHWGELVTGGVLIGVLAIWGSTGHHVPPTVYWIIAVAAIIVAAYFAWLTQYKRAESLPLELSGRPDITLECLPDSRSSELGRFLFRFSNHSENVAVDLEAQNIQIPLPKTVAQTHRQIEEEILHITTEGPSDATIVFGTISVLARGAPKDLPYRINGAGPLHGQSFKALADATGRSEFPLVVQFANLGPPKKTWRARFHLSFNSITNSLTTHHVAIEEA